MKMQDITSEIIFEEVESRVRSYLKEQGQDPDTDDDLAMNLRAEFRNEVIAELKRKCE